jgi:hypothetical protein
VRHLNGVRDDDRETNLTWGTPLENSMDAKSHGTWVHGEKVNTAKLTPEQVVQIHHMPGNCEEIAKMFDVCFATVSHIKNRRTWKHVPR